MRAVLRSLAALSVLCAPACTTVSAQEDVPAVVTNPSERSRAELKGVVSRALNGAPVAAIADDALTKDGRLIIERVRPRDSKGLPFGGRDLDRPEHFRLVLAGSRCVLVHERTGKRWPLSAATCAPAQK